MVVCGFDLLLSMAIRHISAFGISLALHLLGLGFALATWTPAAERLQSKDNHRVTAAFIVAAAPEDSRFAGLKPTSHDDDGWGFDIGDQSSSVSLGQFSFDIAKIAEHAPVLFPFLTPGLSLEHFLLAPQRNLDERLGNPYASQERKASDQTINRPLILSDKAAQSFIDASWSRRDRWNKFQPIIKLTETYSPTFGELATILQKYRDQNWVQPYVDQTVRDPRLWVELGLAADHVDFVGFIRRYASQHPETKATIELLFFLDKIAQASRAILATVLDASLMKDLTWTRDTNRAAYDLVNEIRRYYEDQLRRRGFLDSPTAIDDHYDKVRLNILSGILRTTPEGYRASDARFLIGTIYWKQGKDQDALRSWREMKVDPAGTYVVASSEMLDALRFHEHQPTSPAQKIRPPFRLEIQRIIDAERGRGRMFSLDRLRQFGYRVDTF
jgi:hypothetical protein